MSVRKPQWYTNKWIYIILVILIIIYFSFKPVTNYLDVNAYLKERIKEQAIELKMMRDSLISSDKRIDKILAFKQKIVIEPNKEEIKRLRKELEYYRKTSIFVNDSTLSVQELFEYIDNNLK